MSRHLAKPCAGAVQEVTQADFPLPALGPKLTAMREEVRTGRGFQLLRCAHSDCPSASLLPPGMTPGVTEDPSLMMYCPE